MTNTVADDIMKVAYAKLPASYTSPIALADDLYRFLHDARCFNGDGQKYREAAWDYAFKLLRNGGLVQREMQGRSGKGCYGIILHCRQLTLPKPKQIAAPASVVPGEWVSADRAAIDTKIKVGRIHQWRREGRLPYLAPLPGKRGCRVELGAVRKLIAEMGVQNA